MRLDVERTRRFGQELPVASRSVYLVTVTFDSGVKATIRTSVEPVLPATIWNPETLSSIGDVGGPHVEFLGRELAGLSVTRILPAMDGKGAAGNFGAD